MDIRAKYVEPKIMTRPKDILTPGGYRSEDDFRVTKILDPEGDEGFKLDKLPQAVITNKHGERIYRVLSKLSATDTFEEGSLHIENYKHGDPLVITYKTSIQVGGVTIGLDDGFYVCAKFNPSAGVAGVSGVSPNATFFCNFPIATAKVVANDIIMYYVREVIHGVVYA
jgi:hypothetical protein